MKTARAIVLPLVLLVSLAFGGCDDDTRIDIRQDAIQFPMGIGMYWVYEVYDSLTATADTVRLSTVDFIDLSGGRSAYVQHSLSYQGDFDRIQIIPHEDTLDVFVGPEDSPVWTDRYVFSLTPGESWTGPLDQFADTSVVADSEVVVTPAGVFERTARVDRHWNNFYDGESHEVTTWFYPSAGIVQRRIVAFEPGPDPTFSTNEVHTLISYDLVAFPRESFPDNPGTWWRYATYDSLSEIADTITVTVRGTLPPVTRTTPIIVWEIRSDAADSAIVDSLYVAANEPALRIAEDTLFTNSIQESFIFPLAVGRTWGLIFIVPAPDITDKRSVEVHAGAFQTAFQSFTPSTSLNDYQSVESWLVPQVGIVKRHHRRYGLGPLQNTTWELLDYSGTVVP